MARDIGQSFLENTKHRGGSVRRNHFPDEQADLARNAESGLEFLDLPFHGAAKPRSKTAGLSSVEILRMDWIMLSANCPVEWILLSIWPFLCGNRPASQARSILDRKSTRLNSSHRCISYAV